MSLPCPLKTEMVIEELENFFQFSQSGGLHPHALMECPVNSEAGGCPMLVCQVFVSHGCLEQFVTGFGNVRNCEPRNEPERAKG